MFINKIHFTGVMCVLTCIKKIYVTKMMMLKKLKSNNYLEEQTISNTILSKN